MERRVTPPKRVTSPTRGPPPPCKQALSLAHFNTLNKQVCHTTKINNVSQLHDLQNTTLFHLTVQMNLIN